MKSFLKKFLVLYLSISLIFMPVAKACGPLILVCAEAVVYYGSILAVNAVRLVSVSRMLGAAKSYCTLNKSSCYSGAASIATHAAIFSITFNTFSKNENTGEQQTFKVNIATLKDLPKQPPNPDWPLNQAGVPIPPSQVQLDLTKSQVDSWPATFTSFNDAQSFVPTYPENITFKYQAVGQPVKYRTLSVKPSIQTGFTGKDAEGYVFKAKLNQKSVDGLNLLVIEKESAMPPVIIPEGYKQNSTDPRIADIQNPEQVKYPVDHQCEVTQGDSGFAFDAKDPDCYALTADPKSPLKISNGQVNIGTEEGQTRIKGLPGNKTEITHYKRSDTDNSQMETETETIEKGSDGVPKVTSKGKQNSPFPSDRPLPDVPFGKGGDFPGDGNSPGTGGSTGGTGSSIDVSSLNKETTQQAIMNNTAASKGFLQTIAEFFTGSTNSVSPFDEGEDTSLPEEQNNSFLDFVNHAQTPLNWSNKSCPAPYPFNISFLGNVISNQVDFTNFCDILRLLRPFLMAGFAFATITVYLGAIRRRFD